jgi:hypothetical protein
MPNFSSQPIRGVPSEPEGMSGKKNIPLLQNHYSPTVSQTPITLIGTMSLVNPRLANS